MRDFIRKSRKVAGEGVYKREHEPVCCPCIASEKEIRELEDLCRYSSDQSNHNQIPIPYPVA